MDKISFKDYVAECLDHCVSGLITEREMADKIRKAAWEGMSGVELPTHDMEAGGVDMRETLYRSEDLA